MALAGVLMWSGIHFRSLSNDLGVFRGAFVAKIGIDETRVLRLSPVRNAVRLNTAARTVRPRIRELISGLSGGIS